MSKVPLFQQESNVKNTNEVFYIIHFFGIKTSKFDIYVTLTAHVSLD